MEVSFGVASVDLVGTECVPGECVVVLRGLVKGTKDGEPLYFQQSSK